MTNHEFVSVDCATRQFDAKPPAKKQQRAQQAEEGEKGVSTPRSETLVDIEEV